MENTSVVTIHKLLESRQTALKNFLGSQKNALRFISSVMQCINMTPKLLLCKHESLVGAFLECAAVGLFPSSWSGECYVLPYDSKDGMMAQFQMGYKGFITLGYRSGVQSIWTNIVYKNDKFKEYKGTDPKIEHEVAPGDRGEPIGVYACAKVNGETIFLFMKKDQVMKIKSMSKAKDSKYSPWNSNDPEMWMWKKTAIKQLAKTFPRGDAGQMGKAIYLDNISERGGYIQDEGKIVDVPFDEPDDQKIDSAKDKKDKLKKKKEEDQADPDGFDQFQTEVKIKELGEALKSTDPKHSDHEKMKAEYDRLVAALNEWKAKNSDQEENLVSND